MIREQLEIDIDRLRAAGIAHLDWRDLLTITGDLPDEDIAAMDEYFRHFAKPEDGKCLNCGVVQGGLWGAFGGFVYGTRHGEGECSTCGYPARAKHYKIGPISRMEVILQYHPDEVLKGEPA